MAINLETLEAKLRLDSKGFQAGLDGATKQVSGFRKILGGVASTAGGFLAANVIQKGFSAFTGNIKGAIMGASDMNESLSKTEAVFGDFAQGVIDWSDKSAVTMGLSRQQALEATSTFGNLFGGMGVGQKEAAGMSEEVLQLAADLASFNNVPVEQALEDIRSGLVGESEPMRKYAVLLDEATVAQKAMAMTGKANAKQLTQQDKLLARNALIFEQTKVAQGDYAKTAGGLANQLRTLSAQLANVRTMLGAFLLPVILRAVSFFNLFLDRIRRLVNQGISPFDAILKSLHTSLNQVFGRTAGNAIYQVINIISDAFKLLFAVLSGGDLGAVFDEIAFDIGKLIDAFSALGARVLNWALNVAAPAVTGWLADHADDAWDAISSAAGWAWDGLVSIADWTLNVGAPKLAGWLLNLAGNFVPWLRGALMGQVQGDATGGPEPGTLQISLGAWTLDTVVPAITGWLKNTAGHVWAGLKAAAQWFFAEAAPLGTWTIDTAVPAITGWLKRTAEHPWAALKAAAQWFFTEGVIASGWALSVGAPVVASEDFQAIATSIGDGIKSAVSASASVASAIASGVVDRIDSVSDWKITTETLFGLGVAFGSALFNLLSQAPSLVSAIVDGISAAVKGIKDLDVDWVNVATKIVEGIGLAVAALVAAPVLIAAAIGTMIAGAIAGFAFGEDVTFDEVADAIKGGIIAAINAVEDWKDTLTTAISDKIGDLSDALTDKGGQLVEGIKTGWGDFWREDFGPTASEAAQWAFNWVKNGAVKPISALVQHGKDLIQGLMNGWTEKSNELAGWAQAFGSWIYNQFPDMSRILWSIGHALMIGLRDGIQWGWNNLVKPLLDTITGLIPSFKGPEERDRKLLQPSGRAIMRGLTLGIRQGVPSLERTLSAVTAGIPAMTGTPRYTAAMAALNGGRGGNSYQFYGPVHFPPGYHDIDSGIAAWQRGEM